MTVCVDVFIVVMRVCGCLGMCVYGYVWVYECMYAREHECVGLWMCGYMGVWRMDLWMC